MAVVAAIVTAVASETAGIATNQTTAVASTVDPLARQVATVLEIQNSLYNFHQGIFLFDLQTSDGGGSSAYLLLSLVNKETVLAL